MKFCKDCKHYQQFREGLMLQRIQVHECTAKPAEYDLVTGTPQYRFANVERTIINEENHCCKEGNWFEPIEPSDLDDLSTIPFGR